MLQLQRDALQAYIWPDTSMYMDFNYDLKMIEKETTQFLMMQFNVVIFSFIL